MQFYFIRHAQSENNLLYAQTGSDKGRSSDPDLTPLGQQQAEKLAQFLAAPGQALDPDPGYDSQDLGGFAITYLYCSLMVRSVATGVTVARVLDLPLVAWEDLHETGGIHQREEVTGERIGLPGNNRAYFETHFPDLVLPERLGEEGWWNRPFEEREQRPLRARRVWNDLLDRHGHGDDRVAVIAHGGFYNHLMRVILNLPEELECWFSLNNAAITRIDVGDRVWIQYMNRLDFMPREMIS